jgi:hypothetical protein
MIAAPLLWLPINRQWLAQVAVMALVMLFCSLPWLFKNFNESNGRFIPFAAVAGEVLLDGTNPAADGRPTNKFSLAPDIEAGMHPVDRDKARMRQAIDYIKADPAWFLRLTLKKFLLGFLPARDFLFEAGGQPRFFNVFLSRWVASLADLIVMVGAALGIWMSRRNRKNLLFGLVCVLCPILIQTIFFAYPRYRFPFLFLLIPFVGIAATSFFRNAECSESGEQSGN